MFVLGATFEWMIAVEGLGMKHSSKVGAVVRMYDCEHLTRVDFSTLARSPLQRYAALTLGQCNRGRSRTFVETRSNRRNHATELVVFKHLSDAL